MAQRASGLAVTKLNARRRMSETAARYADLIVDPETYATPDRLNVIYQALRTDDPFAWMEPEGYRPFWAATRHEDIQWISKQKALFTNSERNRLSPITSEALTCSELGNTNPVRTLVQMDDPDHFRMRHLTQIWFQPRQIVKREAHIRQIAAHFIDRMEARGPACDFMQDIAPHYPLRIVMQLIGVPEADEPLILSLTQRLFGSHDEDYACPTATTPAARFAARTRLLREFSDYFQALIRDRRKHPKDDLASLLANAEIEGRPIGDFELLSYFIILSTAGHDTTSACLGGGVLALLRNPAQMAKVLSDPKGLAPTLTEEAIRWTSPVKHFMRTAQEDVMIRGQKVRKGESIMLCYPSANRDEAVFHEPHRFYADRSPNPHIAFGYGGHMCLGLHLARLELHIFFEALFSRLEHIELAGEASFMKSSFVSGPKTLPVRYQFR